MLLACSVVNIRHLQSNAVLESQQTWIRKLCAATLYQAPCMQHNLL